MNILRKIKHAIYEQNYHITGHANEEAANDWFISSDIEQIIYTGAIARKLTSDPRGTRYEILGKTYDGRKGMVVCRFLPDGKLRIITAYKV